MQVQPLYGILRGIVHQDDTAGAVAFLQRAGGQKARTAAETDIGDLYCPRRLSGQLLRRADAHHGRWQAAQPAILFDPFAQPGLFLRLCGAYRQLH